MLLITGGAFQGKFQYALALKNAEESTLKVADPESCSYEELETCHILRGFHLLIRRLLTEEREIYPLLETLLAKNPDILIITDELGCGIVPVDPFDRLYRETTGRACCYLAERAREVHRVTCGIGTVIKHG